MPITFTHEKITVGVINRKLPFPESFQDKTVDGMVGEGTGYAYHPPVGVLRKSHPDAWMVSKLSNGSSAVMSPLPANSSTAEMLIEVLHERREELATSHYLAQDASRIAQEMMESGQGKWVTL